MKITKDIIQKKAHDIWKQKNKQGLLAMATGTGKSKVAINEVKDLYRIHKTTLKILLIVPTELLRDANWRKEFHKWDAEKEWWQVRRECYASLHKIALKELEEYHLIILDEVHYITPANSKNILKCTSPILSLTATVPDDIDKLRIINKISPVIFTYTLDEAVKDGLVAPFEIIVVEYPLDNKVKNIKSGTKAKPFFQTEKAKYDYLSSVIGKLMYSGAPEEAKKFAYLNRMRFIYNLPSKKSIARMIIKKYMKGRYLVFGGSINQIEELCAPYTYHSKTDDTQFQKFVSGKISKLGVVQAVNEGHNIPNLDMALIVQLNSRELDLIQRIGRIVRYRPGHLAKVYIIIAENTQDQVWLKKALSNFDQSNVTFRKIYQV